ncbi:unnamed protein product [Closterium sp. Naga37s-1]|nr:unnamed protein product [Closterium sp. Naga37s-1]
MTFKSSQKLVIMIAARLFRSSSRHRPSRARAITRGDVYIVRLRRAPVAVQVSAPSTAASVKFSGALSPDSVSTTSAALFSASINSASAGGGSPVRGGSDSGSSAASAGSGSSNGGVGTGGAARRLLTEARSVEESVSARMARDGGDVAREGARRNRRKLAAADWGAETRNGRPWFDRSSALIQSLVDTLQDEQNKVARQAGLTNITRDILYRYFYISNGFAAVLTAAQAESLRSDVRVLQVLRSRAVQKQTSETPALLNLPKTFWSASYTGEDAVIGVVDTGIWPENPSFSEVWGNGGWVRRGAVLLEREKGERVRVGAREGQREGDGNDVILTLSFIVSSPVFSPFPSLLPFPAPLPCSPSLLPFPAPLPAPRPAPDLAPLFASHPLAHAECLEGYSGFPRSWHALSTDCARTADFKGCSRKLVQASFFPTAFESEFGEIDTSSDWRSPRDADGHGSWVAAAAAGNRDTPMTVARGQTVGAGSGTAPRARIAAYKVFWRSSESSGLVATTADIEQAMDQAVADGCAVILLALGAVDGGQSYFDDLPVLYASMAGTLVVAAAGNGGKGSEAARTVVNFSPFYLTVGATTINRRFSAKLMLSNGSELDVNGLGAGSSAITNVPIIHSPDAKLASAAAAQESPARFQGSTLLSPLQPTATAITNVPISPAKVGKGGSATRPGRTGLHPASFESTETPPLPLFPLFPLLPGGRVCSAPGTLDPALADGCAPGTLDPALVNGKLVVCVAGGDVPLTAKVTEAKAKGAVGVVLHSSPRTNQPYARDLPVVGVSVGDSDSLLAFLQTPNPPLTSHLSIPHSPAPFPFFHPAPAPAPPPIPRPLTLLPCSPHASLSSAFTTASDLPAPVMYATSSTGPLSQGATTDVFKPDLVAPGAFIWAASRGTTLSDTTEFKIGSGTSVAAAHVAGVAALLMQWNPALTPVQVMSVLTTTANATMVRQDPVKADAPTPMDMGAGHLDVDEMFSPGPGLVYNAEVPHFLRFLTGQDAALAGKILQDGQEVSPLAARDLNRAAIAVSNLQGAVTVTRVVTNLGATATYKASVVEPAGVDVEVTPASFTIETGAANAMRFSVKLTPRAGAAAAGSGWRFGSLTWSDSAGHRVKSVIAVEV